MSSAATARPLMTLEEFYEWDSRDDQRYELIDGVPVAMAPPRNAHGTIAINLAWGLRETLRTRPPGVAMSEVGILSPTRRNTFYQADLAVSCQPQDPDGHEMKDPLLIAEVLSPSTENQDRKVKLVEYRRIPGVREVLMVDSTRLYAELHRRLEGDRWLVELIVDPQAALRLESIGAELPLSEIYANVSFDVAGDQVGNR